jgi:hypothetical protein
MADSEERISPGAASAVARGRALEHDPEKWKPVFGKDHAPRKNLDRNPMQLDRIMV